MKLAVNQRKWAACSLILLFFFLVSGTAFCQTTDDAQAEGLLNESSAPLQIQNKLKLLRQEIKRKGYEYEVGYTSVSEVPIKNLCGLVEPSNWQSEAPFVLFSPNLQALPSSWDWREHGGVTPVKNQGGCGSCWAFGTVAPLESQIKINCGDTVDLSEQYLVSCNNYGYGCSGGWFAHNMHESPGAVLESAFPYRAADVTCGGPYSHPYSIDNWAYIGSSSGVPSTDAIKQAIYYHGPVAAAVAVDSAFNNYRSGIFQGSYTYINHAITLVGWNDADGGYWILKNSWGTGWGESGYMRIKYGANRVGYAANYVQFSMCGTDPPAPEPTLDCASALDLNASGKTYSGTTIGGNSIVNGYGCQTWDESGPEVVHKITTTAAGDISATLSNLSADLDVFILSACDPSGSCLAGGDTTATYANAPAGTYYFVVDGYNGASGSYKLSVQTADQWTHSLLWSSENTGLVTLWQLDANNNQVGSQDYGPYSGWTGTSYHKNSDGTAQLLWTRINDGYTSLWSLDTSGNMTAYKTYGPFPGWTATSYHKNSDGTAQLLLTRSSDGYTSLWSLNAAGDRTTYKTYGPFPGWTATSYHKNSDGTAQLLLTRSSDGYTSLWSLNAAGDRIAYKTYGPFPGWTATSYHKNSDGTAQLLWTRSSDGYTSLWSLNTSDNMTAYKTYEPKVGSTAQSYE